MEVLIVECVKEFLRINKSLKNIFRIMMNIGYISVFSVIKVLSNYVIWISICVFIWMNGYFFVRFVINYLSKCVNLSNIWGFILERNFIVVVSVIVFLNKLVS